MPSNPPRNSDSSRPRFEASALVVVACLLVLPVLALGRLSAVIDAPILAAVALALSAFAFIAHWRDKRAAESSADRIQESTLHLLELLGGWPGAFLAQRFLRHKTAKVSYQFWFWCIVLFHQYLAADCLLHWRLAHAGFRFLHSQLACALVP